MALKGFYKVNPNAPLGSFSNPHPYVPRRGAAAVTAVPNTSSSTKPRQNTNHPPPVGYIPAYHTMAGFPCPGGRGFRFNYDPEAASPDTRQVEAFVNWQQKAFPGKSVVIVPVVKETAPLPTANNTRSTPREPNSHPATPCTSKRQLPSSSSSSGAIKSVAKCTRQDPPHPHIHRKPCPNQPSSFTSSPNPIFRNPQHRPSPPSISPKQSNSGPVTSSSSSWSTTATAGLSSPVKSAQSQCTPRNTITKTMPSDKDERPPLRSSPGSTRKPWSTTATDGWSLSGDSAVPSCPLSVQGEVRYSDPRLPPRSGYRYVHAPMGWRGSRKSRRENDADESDGGPTMSGALG